MFEVQLTTLADDIYNKLAHVLLYKSTPGYLTPQDEMLIDLSHGLGRCFGLCERILKDKLNPDSKSIEEIQENEPGFTEIIHDFGPKTSTESRRGLSKFINEKNREIGDYWALSSRVK